MRFTAGENLEFYFCTEGIDFGLRDEVVRKYAFKLQARTHEPISFCASKFRFRNCAPMLSPSIFLTKAVHLITLLDTLGLKRNRIVLFSSGFSPVSLRNSIPVLDKFTILTVLPSVESLLEKQVPVNKTRPRKDFLFSKITRNVVLQIHSISQFLEDISISNTDNCNLAARGAYQFSLLFANNIYLYSVHLISDACGQHSILKMSKVNKSYPIKFRHSFSAGSRP